MALNFINSTPQSPFYVQVYSDKAPSCDRVLLESVLDPDEARDSRLDRKTFQSCVRDILANESDRLTVIAFSRQNNQPVALAAFKKHAYNPNMLTSLPGQTIRNDVLQIRRKALWEVQYVVRHVQFKSQCLGDIVLSCGLEQLGALCLTESRVTTNLWLIVSNSFLNSSAIRLYLSCGFQMAALYQSTLMMFLSDLNPRLIDKVRKSMTVHIESVFLLPYLKNSNQPSSSGPSARQVEQSTLTDQQVDVEATSMSDTDSSSQISTAPRPTRQRRNDSDNQALEGGSQNTANMDELVNDTLLSSLQFVSFAEHLKWTPTIVNPVEDGINAMIRNTEMMLENSKAMDERHSFLQHLEMAKQIEIFSKRIGKHSYDAIYDLRNDDLGLSIQYLRAVLRVSWAVYRFPILELCKMPWKVGMKRIPQIAAALDRLIENNERFPSNITAAQADLHSLCVRVFLQFPERPVGDGDGLPHTTVLSVHGILQNDAPIGNLDDSYESTTWYRRIQSAVGKDMRSRIVGYDTQEAPRPNDERDVDTPQPYWREGRTFLLEELWRMLGDVPPQSAVMVVDCFSVDIYDRLLIDIRGVYHSNQMATGNLHPSLGRLELAHRALSSGYAFPTHNFLVTQALLEAFDTARLQHRGMFGSAQPVYHPSVCRRHRYEMSKNQTRARRRRYDE